MYMYTVDFMVTDIGHSRTVAISHTTVGQNSLSLHRSFVALCSNLPHCRGRNSDSARCPISATIDDHDSIMNFVALCRKSTKYSKHCFPLLTLNILELKFLMHSEILEIAINYLKAIQSNALYCH